jgi:hypothetical protein
LIRVVTLRVVAGAAAIRGFRRDGPGIRSGSSGRDLNQHSDHPQHESYLSRRLEHRGFARGVACSLSRQLAEGTCSRRTQSGTEALHPKNAVGPSPHKSPPRQPDSTSNRHSWRKSSLERPEQVRSSEATKVNPADPGPGFLRGMYSGIDIAMDVSKSSKESG